MNTMKNKRGWITVLEATIAVMLVSGVLIIVYARQGVDDTSVQDYIFSLQRQILADIASRSDLRNYVLVDGEDEVKELNVFVRSKIPPAYNYSLKICSLGDEYNHCLLNTEEVIATREKGLFAEEIVVSAELGDGNNPTYEPRKVRLFVWGVR